MPQAPGRITRVMPPRKLTALERRHWVAVVDGLPAGFFGPEHAQQLAAYVNHAALAEVLGAWLLKAQPDDPKWAQVNAAQVAHSKAALAFARSLRITNNSRADRDAAATAARRGSTGPATIEQLRQRYEDSE
jgi:hypothetical protein